MEFRRRDIKRNCKISTKRDFQNKNKVLRAKALTHGALFFCFLKEFELFLLILLKRFENFSKRVQFLNWKHLNIDFIFTFVIYLLCKKIYGDSKCLT